MSTFTERVSKFWERLNTWWEDMSYRAQIGTVLLVGFILGVILG
jgi:hypothetical protein